MIKYIDPETGLLYLRARYYDPNTAQFLTPDPLTALTGERYGYAGNNPLNAGDPSGLCGESEAQLEKYSGLTGVCGMAAGGAAASQFKKLSNSEADRVAKDFGYKGAENMKAKLRDTPKSGAHFDIYKDSDGDYFVGPKKMTADSERLYQTGSSGNGEGEYGDSSYWSGEGGDVSPTDPDIGGPGGCAISYQLRGSMAGGCGDSLEDPWDWSNGDEGLFDLSYSPQCSPAGKF